MGRGRSRGVGRGRALLVCALAAGTAGIFLFARAGGMEGVQRHLAAAGLFAPGASATGVGGVSAQPAAAVSPEDTPGTDLSAPDREKENAPDPNDPEFMDSVVQRAVESMFENHPHARREMKPGGGVSARSAADEKGDASGPHGAKGDDDRKPSDKEDAKALSAQASAMTADAVAAMKAGRFDEAMGLLEKSLELDPANRQSYQTLATLSKRLGLTDQELRAYDRWMEALPDDAVARYMAAQAYTRNGYDQEAVARLREFQAMNAGDPRAYPMAADLYRKLGMRAEEGAALQQWAADTPSAPDAHRALGDYYRRMGDYGAALGEYEATAAMTPNDPAAYLQMGNTYRRMGQYEDALAQYEQAVALRPGNLSALSQLAETQRQVGDYAAAIASYERVIAAEPGSQQAAGAERGITRIERDLARAAQPAKPKKPKSR